MGLQVKRTILLITMLALILLMKIPYVNSEVQEPVIVSIEELGISIIEYRVDVVGGQTIDCIGQCLFVLQLTPENALYFMENNTISIVSQTDNLTTYDIVVVSQIASPIDNNTWTINITLPYDTIILLPLGSVPVNVNPTPTNVTLINQRLALYLPKGNLTLTYTYIVEHVTQTETTTTPTSTQTQTTATQTTTTQQTTITTTTQTTPTQTQTPKETTTTTSPPTTTTTTTQTTQQSTTKETTTQTTITPQKTNTTKYAALLVGLIIIGAALYYLKNRGKGETEGKIEEIEDYLDERDRSIINLLKERGPMQPSEMIRILDMPRSAFYRRINRLKEMGLIEQISLKGKTYYKIKEKG